MEDQKPANDIESELASIGDRIVTQRATLADAHRLRDIAWSIECELAPKSVEEWLAS